MRRLGSAALPLLAAFACTGTAFAQSPEPSSSAAPPTPTSPASELAIEVTPIFGAGTALTSGWNEVVARLQNRGGKPARGTLEVTATGYGEPPPFVASAPYTVAAGASVTVRLPIYVAASSSVRVRVEGEGAIELASIELPSRGRSNLASPLLVDVSEPSRLRVTVGEAVIAPSHLLASPGYGAVPQLAVGSPRFDPSTGDPVLPDRAALWSAATAVVVRSSTLAHLVGPELDALAGYVLGGGTLAVVVVRPEDLRHPTVVSLVGGEPSPSAVAPATLRTLVLPAPPAGSPGGLKSIEPAPSPSADVRRELTGYAGGNLHPSLYGSSAAYGLGEVHLLAFDPTAAPAVDDPWAQARVVDLVRRASDRRSTLAYRGVQDFEPDASMVRKRLDPNESSRWAIGAATLLLCVYAVVAGPVSFAVASRRGKPLAALRWLPIFAAAAFAMIVAIGVAAKGVRGRARHLTLIEAGAGMTQGTARRWRGFFTPRGKGLVVRTTDGSSVVATANLDDPGDRRDHLVVDRDGARLVGVVALPWQTVVVREDGLGELGAGIAVAPGAAAGEATIVNRSGRDLRAGVLVLPNADALYFGRIRDGERVSSAAGRLLSSTPAGRSWQTAITSATHAGRLPVHRLDARGLVEVFADDAPGLADAWWALESSAGDAVDWFPDDVPVLIGQLDGGEGRLVDSGLRLESDRLLVRVVGWGGKP